MSDEALKERHQSEIAFHNKKYSQEKKSFYDFGFTDLIFNDMLKKIGDLTNKKVVDFGCGNGWLTEILLKKGAEVWAFDISEEAINITSKKAKRMNLSERVHFDVMPAEHLSYKDDFFDVVVGVAILHHLDINLAACEILRVLKSKGTSYFMEPLAHNPLINFYRKRTPEIRSADETPLHDEDLTILKGKFRSFSNENYYLITLLSLFWYYVIYNEKLTLKTRDILFKLDILFLRAFPVLKRYCWYSILTMQK